MRIDLYKFAKKPNSLAIPTNVQATSLDCLVKTPSSVINPTVQVSKNINPVDFNYAYISDWDRYYFIQDITYNLGTWLIDLRVDVLASYRSNILNSQQYVLRSYSQFNGNIVDNIYTTKADANNAEVVSASGTVTDPDYQLSIPNYFNKSYEDGRFVIGVISNNETGMTYYELDFSSFARFVGALMSFVPSDMTDLANGTAKSLFDPLQYITSCVWYPASINRGITPVLSAINIGGYSIQLVTLTGGKVNVRTNHYRTSVTIPKHPQSSAYPYLQLAPYSIYNLFFEPFGNIPLDSLKMYGGDTLDLDWYLDIATGQAELMVMNGNKLVANANAIMGVQVQLSQLTVDVVGAMSSIAGGFAGGAAAFLANDVGGAVNSVISGIGNAINSMLPQLSSMGNNGSFLSYVMGAPKLHALYNIQVDTDEARYGRPLCEVKRIGDLSGYCLCSNSSIEIGGTSAEASEIESMLNSGVFIE